MFYIVTFMKLFKKGEPCGMGPKALHGMWKGPPYSLDSRTIELAHIEQREILLILFSSCEMRKQTR